MINPIEVHSDEVSNIVYVKSADNEELVDAALIDNDTKQVIISKTLNRDQEKKFIDMIEAYKNVFATSIADLKGCKIGSHHLKMNDPNPIYIRQYRISNNEKIF